MSTYPIPLALHLPPNILYFNTRADYLKRCGFQAPPYNPSRVVKNWVDTDPGSYPTVSYTAWVRDSNPVQILPLTLSSTEASTVNMRGEYTYPKFEIQPTPAIGTSGPIPPNEIILLTQAQAVAASLGKGWSVKPTSPYPGFPVQWNGEQRQYYSILKDSDPGTEYDAANLFLQWMSGGIGAPGHWIFPTTGGPQWQIDPQNIGMNASGEVATPIIPLLPNEKIIYQGISQTPMIVDQSTPNPVDVRTGSSVPAGTASDPRIDRILKILEVLNTRFTLGA
jgi:hypothetical protein